RECGALAKAFPEADALFGVPQPERWHPEVDTGVHVLMAMRMAAKLSAGDPTVAFALLTHGRGKGMAPVDVLPRHPGREQRAVELLEALCERLPVPRAYRDLALHGARHHGVVHRSAELRPATVLSLLDTVDAFRRPERFEAFLIACEADARGRKGLEDRPYPQGQRLRAAFAAARAVDPAALIAEGYTGAALGEALRQRRIDAIRAVWPRRGGRS